jgi:hypothetical protein
MSDSKIKVLALTICFTFVLPATTKAQTSSYQDLQAAYIFNFAKYVTWPELSSVFVVGVYGDGENIKYLKYAFQSKRISGKDTEVRIIATEEDTYDCNIIYVPESGSKNLKTLLAAIEGKSILVVTEDDLTKRGAAISFIVQDDRLKFKLKKSALAAAQLRASDGLLKLAIIE